MDYHLALSAISPPASSSPETLDELFSPVFFDLANSKTVTYNSSVIHQDVEASDTTGGIIWESGYLLTTYLLSLPLATFSSKYLLDTGSGPGLLGIALASCFPLAGVTVSECEQVRLRER